MLTIDVILLAQQIQHAFELKKDPLNASRVGAPLGVLLNSLLRLALEIFFIVNRWINMPRANSLLVNLRSLFSWMGELDGMWRRLFVGVASVVSSALVMTTDPSDDGEGDEAAWMLLGISTLLQGSTTVVVMFMPLRKAAIYLKSIENAMANDVVQFLQFLVFFTLIFWVSL